MSVRLLLLGLTAFLFCLPSLCDRRPVTEFTGRLSINGIAAEDSDATNPHVGVNGNPFVSAPSSKNGPPRSQNLTASMPTSPHTLKAGKRATATTLWPGVLAGKQLHLLPGARSTGTRCLDNHPPVEGRKDEDVHARDTSRPNQQVCFLHPS